MLLRAENVSLSYTRRSLAVEGVGCAPQPGRVTALVGPNGSGKSTLLRLLMGSLRPSAGSVLLGDEPTCRMNPRKRARSIAYIAQRPDAAFAYQVREVVALGRLALGTSASEDRRAVDSALDLMELKELADRSLTALSVGQQQRVAIARAIAQLDPSAPNHPGRILLADEPTAALDPKHAAHTLSVMRKLAHEDQVAVVVVLHDLQSALRYADDALLMARGRAVAQGPVAQILAPDFLEPVFAIGFVSPAAGVLVAAPPTD